MGNCGSCESRSTATAKLVLLNGEFQEFSSPVKVSDLLQQSAINPDEFVICNSDEMELNQLLAEVGGDDVLHMGEVYFQVPLGWRNRRLTVEDMAALAVKANVALSGGDDHEDMVSCCCLAKRVDHAVLYNYSEKEIPLLAVAGGGDEAAIGCRKGSGRRRCGSRKFIAKLSMIAEEI